MVQRIDTTPSSTRHTNAVRIAKRADSSAFGGRVGYLRMVYSGSDVSFETDSAGTMGLKYAWGPGSDNLLAIQDAAGNHYYATTDRLGSVRTLATRSGTWLLTRRWDPYGNEMTRDSSASFTWGNRLRYGWTEREYDVETGLYHLRARYYSSSLRRFLAKDPVEGSSSPYAYVHGSPLEATDPSGMMDAYEMRMPDPRWDFYAHGGGTRSDAFVDGVPVGGNAGWLNGIVASGGATRVEGLSAVDIAWDRQMTVIQLNRVISFASKDPEHAAMMRDNWTLARSILERSNAASSHELLGRIDLGSRSGFNFQFVDAVPVVFGEPAVSGVPVVQVKWGLSCALMLMQCSNRRTPISRQL